MNFWRTCCASNAVAPCSASEQNYDIARFRAFSDNKIGRSSCNHSSKFHPFCNVAGMIDFFDQTCCKTYLVPIRRKSLRSFSTKFNLRQFPLHRIAQRDSRVRSPCYTHWLINPRTPRKWVSDCTAKTSSSTSKRLYLCRMVVSFVFKHHKPALSSFRVCRI